MSPIGKWLLSQCDEQLRIKLARLTFATSHNIGHTLYICTVLGVTIVGR